MGRRSSGILYVGNLPSDIREKDVEDLFYKYGPIREIDLKIPPRSPGYAFVEFEDVLDAEDAIEGRDGYKFDGYRLRVEFSHGGRGYSSDYHGGHNRDSYYNAGARGPPRRSDYRVMVTGLPSSASWQDLKDHMRKAGDVTFSQVFRDREGLYGVVDYTNHDDMKYAIRKLDDSEFRNAFSRSYIRVREYDHGRSPSRSYSRSPSLSRSRSRSRSYNQRRSESPPGKYSRSRSRSAASSRSVSSHHASMRSQSRSPTRSRSPPQLEGNGESRRSASLSRSPSVQEE